MSSLFKRLVSSLAAYQLADLVSKFIAVLLLPVYTRYIAPPGFGRVELLANGVIFVSIFVRFGMIEAFLRFYYTDEDPDRRDVLARRATLFLLVSTTVAAVAMLLAAAPLARVVLGGPGYTGLFRIAVLGLWSFTNLELAYGLLRVDERIRTYAIASLTNVLLTILATVILVVVRHRGAEGYLLGNYGISTLVLLAMWWSYRHRLRPRPAGADAQRLGVLLRFGLPTVPAELSVYALSIIDRYYLLHTKGAGPVGLYSIAVKLAGSVAFIVRAFQYAWPPLAYSITDDVQAARFYSLVTTYYVVISGWVVAGLALTGRWIVRLLAAPEYAGAYRALPWLALGWAMYGLWVVFLVIAGRVGATRRNFPAALAGLVANVVLIAVLVSPLGIAGAGIALCGAYLAMLTVMYLLTRHAFTVPFEWGRLIRAVVVIATVTVLGELLAPTRGAAGLALRITAFAVIPLVLWAVGFAHAAERERLRRIGGRLLPRSAT